MHALLLTLTLALTAQQRAHVDSIVRYVMGDRHVLGIALAVVRGDRLVYSHGYGFADRRRTIGVTPATDFAIGSLTKSFVAASVLRLAERNRLSLDDRLERYVPWYANARDVTIAELLAHRSGIPDYAQLPGFTRTQREPVSPEDLVRRVSSLPLLFTPGTEYAYSNTDYVLLGIVVQRVTGMPLAQWLHRDLFARFGLESTASWNPFLSEPGRAEGSVAAGTASLAFGAGNVESNALDLGRWVALLFAGNVVDARDRSRMFGGMGFESGNFGGRHGAWHSGYVEGYSAFVALIPAQRLGVVILSNADTIDLAPLAESVVDDVAPR